MVTPNVALDIYCITNKQLKHIVFDGQVWRETRKIGCGQAVSKGKVGGTFTVYASIRLESYL